MIYLLDTHLLLWWLADDPKLSRPARDIIGKGSHGVYVSAATAWEISIKRSIGKLKAPDDLENALSTNHFQALPITLHHALIAGHLPRHHEDPFDRMLVAQAQFEGLTLLTHDRRLKPYGRFVALV